MKQTMVSSLGRKVLILTPKMCLKYDILVIQDDKFPGVYPSYIFLQSVGTFSLSLILHTASAGVSFLEVGLEVGLEGSGVFSGKRGTFSLWLFLLGYLGQVWNLSKTNFM